MSRLLSRNEPTPSTSRRHACWLARAKGTKYFSAGMRHDFASPHAFLNRFRQFAHQGQATADPADRASEATGQLFLGQLESLVEFHEQPALLQRRFRFPRVPQPTHHQGFRLAALPAEAADCVAAETAQGTHALVAIDHYKVFITTLLHHHDRNLLADFSERAQ